MHMPHYLPPLPKTVALASLPRISLSHAHLCDLELLATGAMAPLAGYMNQQTYESVVDAMRLPDGNVWPMPVVLDISQTTADALKEHTYVALCNAEHTIIAVLEIDAIWQPDKIHEAEAVYGTTNSCHPGVKRLIEEMHTYYIGGKLYAVPGNPGALRFIGKGHYYYTPAMLKAHIKKHGWQRVVAFQTRNPLHHVHVALTRRAMEQVDAKLLLHPAVGQTKPGDIPAYIRLRCYKQIMPYYPQNSALLSLLPIAMRMAGPREALWHALIRKNYGATHFIIGRDHASPGNDAHGNPYYGPYDAHDLVAEHGEGLGITPVMFEAMAYAPATRQYITQKEAKEKALEVKHISGTELRRCLEHGEDIPEWFTPKAILEELRYAYPRKHDKGMVLFFTGLSAAGKSTLANRLASQLAEEYNRQSTMLDGDIIRTIICPDLGFSKDDRNQNVRRVGYIAKEIARHGGLAICALISPYAEIRAEVRKMVEKCAHFVEIFVDTPLSVCEERDPKKLYAKARAGEIKGFTGIDDVYEMPESPELRLHTEKLSPEENVQKIVEYLLENQYIRP